MARITRGRRSRRNMLPEVTLTPLIDTALTLLIIFMITTPMLQNSLKIELPRGKMSEHKSDRQELVVAVSKDGKVALGDTMVSFDSLAHSLKAKMGGKKNQTVFVRGDKASNYGQVIKIVEALKQIDGVAYVALATNVPASA